LIYSYSETRRFLQLPVSVQLPDWAVAPLNDLPTPIPPADEKVSDITLPNGLRLIVRSDFSSPTIRLRGSVKHLELPQSKGDSGALFDVLEEMFNYGTATTNQSMFQKELDEIAVDERAGYDFSLDVLKYHFSRGVQLLAENELRPSFRAKELSIVKKQTSRAVADRVKSPEYRCSEALNMALLPPTDPQQQEFRLSAFKQIRPNSVRRYFEKTVRPDLTTIVIVGDVSPEEAKAVIERWFGDWEANGPAPATTLPPVPLNQASTVHVFDPQSLNDSVTIAEQLDINRFDPDYYPLQLGNAILGGDGAAARLYHDLRQISGYVYGVEVDLDATKTRAQYSISYGAAPENTAKARALIEQNLEQMKSVEVSDEELHQAKSFLVRQIPLSEVSEEDIADALLARAETGLPLDEEYRAVQKYLILNASDVKAAFAKRIHLENLVEVIRGPESQ
jgi:zinc protease